MLLKSEERSRKEVHERDIYTFEDLGFQTNGQTFPEAIWYSPPRGLRTALRDSLDLEDIQMATNILMRCAGKSLILSWSVFGVKSVLIVRWLKPEFYGRFLVGSAFGFMPGIQSWMKLVMLR